MQYCMHSAGWVGVEEARSQVPGQNCPSPQERHRRFGRVACFRNGSPRAGKQPAIVLLRLLF